MWILIVPFVVCGLALAAVCFAVARRFGVALVLLLLALLLNAWSETVALHPAKVRYVTPAPRDTSDLRIMTYNVYGTSQYLADSKGRSEGAAEMAEVVERMHPDVVALPEYNHIFSPPLGDTLEAHYPYNTRVLMDNYDHGEVNVYSRYPIRNLRRFSLPIDTVKYGLMSAPVWSKIWWMDMDVDGRTVKFVYCHLLSNMYTAARQRTVRDSLSWWDGRKDYWECIQIGYHVRAVQARAIRDSLATWDGPVIVCGDLNDLGGSYALRTIKGSRLRDAWWESGSGFGFTYDSYHLLLRLDHILVSRDFVVKGTKIVTATKLSDHYPLVADLAWR